MRPLVSICIPNYNGERFLKAAIESALSQTYPRIEVVVVDNASTDGSWNIIGSFRKAKKVRQRINVGYNDNLNTCVAVAKGKYIKILHSDDVLESDAVEKQVAMMENNPSTGLVYGSANFMDENGIFIKKFSVSDEDFIVHGTEKLKELLEGNHIIFPSVMMRKECFESVGIFDGEIPYCNDWDMWMRICMKYDIGHIGSVTASYRTYSSSGGTVRYETTDISGLQQYRCLSKILSVIKDVDMLKRRSHYYKRLAKEQISRGLDLARRGKRVHGRRYIMSAAVMCDSFWMRLASYLICLATYVLPAGLILATGKRVIRS